MLPGRESHLSYLIFCAGTVMTRPGLLSTVTVGRLGRSTTFLLADPPLHNMRRKPCRLPVLFSSAPRDCKPPLLLPSGCGTVMAVRGIPSGETLTLCHFYWRTRHSVICGASRADSQGCFPAHHVTTSPFSHYFGWEADMAVRAFQGGNRLHRFGRQPLSNWRRKPWPAVNNMFFHT